MLQLHMIYTVDNNDLDRLFITTLNNEIELPWATASIVLKRPWTHFLSVFALHSVVRILWLKIVNTLSPQFLIHSCKIGNRYSSSDHANTFAKTLKQYRTPLPSPMIKYLIWRLQKAEKKVTYAGNVTLYRNKTHIYNPL